MPFNPRGGSEWRPTDVAFTTPPADPCGRPLRVRHPIPAKPWIEIPATIVISGPTPGFLAGPIPTVFGIFPMTVTVGPPIRFDSGWNPTTTVRRNDFPLPIGLQRLVKIGFGADLNFDYLHRLGWGRRCRGRRWSNGRWRRWFTVNRPLSLDVSCATGKSSRDDRPQQRALAPAQEIICFHDVSDSGFTTD